MVSLLTVTHFPSCHRSPPRPLLQALGDGIEAAGQPPPVDGHDEAEALPLRLVLLIVVADVLLDPLIEFPLVGPQVDPDRARVPVGDVLLEQPLLSVDPQQLP